MAKKILVIDDDEDILEILNIIFGEEGYELVLMNTGATPAQIQILNPDLVLLDVRITGYDKTGDEICSAIKAELEMSSTPVVLLSAEEELGQLARTCGADGFIHKPFDVSVLLAKIKELVN